MQTYSFKNVSLIVNGRTISDYHEGDDVITAARRNDAASDVMGADGRMAVAIHADQSGTIKFKVKQTSADAGFLYALVNASQAGSFTTVTAQIKDSRRNDLAIGSFGYVQKPADLVRGKGINLQEWTIVLEALSISADEGSSGIGFALANAIGL